MKQMELVIYWPLFGGKPGEKPLQRQIVATYTRVRGRTVIAEFEETEPGLGELRPAMEAANKAGAILVFSKLGYLTRNLKFLQALAEGAAELQFRALDDKKFNPGTFQVYLTEAKAVWHERRDTIKDAMAKAKKDGAKFGSQRRGARTKNWRNAKPWNAAAEASVEARTERVTAAYALLIPQIQEMVDRGLRYSDIAQALNDAGHLNTSNKPFTAPTVFKILKRHKRQGGRNSGSGRKMDWGVRLTLLPLGSKGSVKLTGEIDNSKEGKPPETRFWLDSTPTKKPLRMTDLHVIQQGFHQFLEAMKDEAAKMVPKAKRKKG
jgi:hypothetical protein